MRRATLTFVILLFLLSAAFAQEAPKEQSEIQKGKPVIAITIFENRSQFPEDSWVAMSFSESLTDKLSKLTERFRVVERLKIYEVMKAQGISLEGIWKSIQARIELGKSLQADYLVVGSVNIEGETPNAKLSATIHTLKLQTEQVKEATTSGQVQQLFDLEEQLTLTFLMQMGISLTREEEQLLITRETTSLSTEKRRRIAQMKKEKILKLQATVGEVVQQEDKIPIAIITGLSGNALFQRSKEKKWERALLNLPLYEGDKVKAQEASQATLWHKNGGTIIIKPKETVTVTTPKDKPQTPFYKTLWRVLTQKVSRSHNQQRFDVMLSIKGEMEIDKIYTLSPRNTRLVSVPESLDWTPTPNAKEYTLTIGHFTGTNKIWQTKVNRASFSLKKAPELKFVSGKTYLWEVEVYDKDRRFMSSDSAWFRILTEREYNAIRDAIELIRREASSDKMTERLLLASFCEEHGLYLESERLLKEALGENGKSSVHLMLADLYLVLGLTKQSRREFQKVEKVSAGIDW